VGPRAGLGWTGGKSHPHWDLIMDRPAHSSVAIRTELPGPHLISLREGLCVGCVTWWCVEITDTVVEPHVTEYMKNMLGKNDSWKTVSNIIHTDLVIGVQKPFSGCLLWGRSGWSLAEVVCKNCPKPFKKCGYGIQCTRMICCGKMRGKLMSDLHNMIESDL